jgi:hypothetical protein
MLLGSLRMRKLGLLFTSLLALSGCALLNPGGVLNPPSHEAPPAPFPNAARCASALTIDECERCAGILRQETAVLSAEDVRQVVAACEERVCARYLKAARDSGVGIDDEDMPMLKGFCGPWLEQAKEPKP